MLGIGRTARYEVMRSGSSALLTSAGGKSEHLVTSISQPATESTSQTTVRYPYQLLKQARIRAATDEITPKSCSSLPRSELALRGRKEEHCRSLAEGR